MVPLVEDLVVIGVAERAICGMFRGGTHTPGPPS